MPNFPMIYADLQISSSYSLLHGLRTPNAMKPFFIENPELLGLGRQIGQINSGAFRTFLAKLKTDRKWMLLLTLLDKWVKSNIHIRSVFISTHFDTFSPLSIFSIIQPKLKYLFGIGILI